MADVRKRQSSVTYFYSESLFHVPAACNTFFSISRTLLTFSTSKFSSHKAELRKKCPYLEFFWSVFSPVSLRIQSNCRKIRTRKIRYKYNYQAVWHKFLYGVIKSKIGYQFQQRSNLLKTVYQNDQRKVTAKNLVVRRHCNSQRI